MFKNFSGECSCGAVTFKIQIPADEMPISPRRCSCSYCSTKQVSYLSHPKAQITLANSQNLNTEKQGSREANFLCCKNCDSLVAVTCSIKGSLRGSVNGDLIKERAGLSEDIAVNPGELSKEEKIDRWESVWGTITAPL